MQIESTIKSTSKANKLSFILILLFSLSCFRLCAESISMPVEKAREARETLCSESKTYLGCPYVYGAHGPDKFDCSGLIYYIAKKTLKINLPRTAKGMYDYADPVLENAKEPGDLVFFKTTSKGIVTHVGIYLGNNMFISALSDGPKRGVVLSSLTETYWSTRYLGARKFLPSGKIVDNFDDSEEYDVEGLLETLDKINKGELSDTKSTVTEKKDEPTKPVPPVTQDSSKTEKKAPVVPETKQPEKKKPVPPVTSDPIYEELVQPMFAILRKTLEKTSLLSNKNMVNFINPSLTYYNGDLI